MKQPNILFLMTDQHRADTLGAYGNPRAATPNLDELASTGTRFDRWYTPTAICTPARASLLTGKAPFRHKLLANHERNVGYIEDLPDGQFTFSEALRDNGYNCGLIGKWHVGTDRSAGDFGFDGPDLPGWHNPVEHPDYLAYLAGNGFPPYEISDRIRGTLPNGGPGNLLAARLHQPVEATFEHYLATRAIEMMERYAADASERDKPFFLALHFFGPHLPYIIPDSYFDLFDPADVPLPRSVAETFHGKPPVQRNYSAHWTFDTMPIETTRKLIAVYWGYVALIDHEIGRVMAAMRRLGLADETAVFFTCDHGEFTGAHRLHDKGPAMYEDIYRTPGIVRVPGGPGGVVRSEFVSLLDCTATILDLAGIDPGPAVDSRSLLPLVSDSDSAGGWDEDIVCEFHGHHFPYPQRMLRTDRYKLVVNPDSVNELYDLDDDPDELVNRYPHPELEPVRTRLMRRLYEILRRRGDNFYHWMTSMYDVGDVEYDPTLSGLDESTYQNTKP
ncbi:arylsulfatase A-like enzyme [Saccharopolyspora erythraea NRRL 2338]|uniref:Sulfatase n=2 Tax=Saccharopolyspora erythraea TaxID=1836 RepID=A4FI25_SACEN|nr:sulfatase-like hydrolase/transferase [Saccharopolyspora erythraea]PFG97383.1 arylsulfatase A-like enzyme [Saccharopolyspora erythraea NRRL 2338]QRK87564.1 sulfatase-like hydrolase/transferase [Saccharopolyspora erythraea]CAM03700.1 sulfatase [Saccharopolyspora erythraea NRRL 2338]